MIALRMNNYTYPPFMVIALLALCSQECGDVQPPVFTKAYGTADRDRLLASCTALEPPGYLLAGVNNVDTGYLIRTDDEGIPL